MDNIFSENRDRISELPDDILLSIMSPMRMEGAVKTSLLSSRWRYLWANQTHLHFNHLVLFPEIVPDEALYLVTADQMAKYVNWVNQVVDLALHCGPCVDTFKVRCIFDNSAAHHIDKWVRFVTLRKVKHLQLSSYNASNVPYSFGLDLLKPSPSPADGDISFLMSLHLDGINITGDVLEFLLLWCPLLERLHVHVTHGLERLKDCLTFEWHVVKFLPSFTYLSQLTLKFERDVHLDIVAITTWLESCQMVREFKIEWPSRDIDKIAIEPDELEKLGLVYDDIEEDDTEDELYWEEFDWEVNGQPLPQKRHPNLKVSDAEFVAASRGRASKFAKILRPKIRVDII